MKSIGLVLLCLSLACGCSALDVSKAKSLWPASMQKPQQPSSIAAIWTEGVAHSAGGVPTRGLAGRIIFYGPDGVQPVKVDGTVTVYAFDESGRGKSDTKPNRKYVFTPEQLANHYDPVKLGPSYALWVPWDGAEGPRKELSLIVRFAPRKGDLVVGEMAKLILNGSTPPTEGLVDAPRRPRAGYISDSMVRATSFESAPAAQPEELNNERVESGLRSTTIPLPDNLARQLASARPTQPAIATRVGGTTVIPAGVAAASASRIPPMASAPTAQPGAATATIAPTLPAPGLALRPSVLPGAHSPLAKPRVPGVVVAPLTRGHEASRQFPAAGPYPHESTPPVEPRSADASISPTDPSRLN